MIEKPLYSELKNLRNLKNKVFVGYNLRNLKIIQFLKSVIFQNKTKIYDINFINNIHKYILEGLQPNITFVLKVSPNASKRRLKKRRTKNRYDNFAQSFYNKAQKSFLKIAKNKKNYFVLDSSKNNSNLENKIFGIVSKHLNI